MVARAVPISRSGADFLRFFQLIENDIYAFAYCMNFKPTWQQCLVMDEVQGNAIHGKPTHISTKSGQGPGKTAVATLCAAWKTLRRFGALTVVTAPTMRQCKEVWLAEFRRMVKHAKPDVARFFEVRATEVEILGVEDWGIKLASATKPDNMAGWHNPYLSFFVDEASGVQRKIIETILGTVTNAEKLVFLAGNPTLRDSAFFDTFNKDRKRWKTITLNAEESPIVDKANINRLAEIYGRESDVFRVRVLGEFPSQDPSCVMSSEDLEACTKTNKLDAIRANNERQFGIDFARYGDDASAIFRRSGNAIVEHKFTHKLDPNRVLALAFEMQHRAAWTNDDCWYVPDAGGIGQGVMHHFYTNKKRVFEFHSEGKAAEGRMYDDSITEAFFNMASLVKTRCIYIPETDDGELIAQLSNRQYYLTLKGLIKLESKEDYKARVQEGSPDKADGCVMAFYNRVATPAASALLHANREREGIGQTGRLNEGAISGGRRVGQVLR